MWLSSTLTNHITWKMSIVDSVITNVCTKLSVDVTFIKQQRKWVYDFKTVVLYLCLTRTKSTALTCVYMETTP